MNKKNRIAVVISVLWLIFTAATAGRFGEFAMTGILPVAIFWGVRWVSGAPAQEP